MTHSRSLGRALTCTGLLALIACSSGGPGGNRGDSQGGGAGVTNSGGNGSSSGGASNGNNGGASNASGAEPERDAVRPADLAATVYSLLGIDPEKKLMAPGGRPIDLVREGRVLHEVLG